MKYVCTSFNAKWPNKQDAFFIVIPLFGIKREQYHNNKFVDYHIAIAWLFWSFSLIIEFEEEVIKK